MNYDKVELVKNFSFLKKYIYLKASSFYHENQENTNTTNTSISSSNIYNNDINTFPSSSRRVRLGQVHTDKLSFPHRHLQPPASWTLTQT